MTAGQVAVLAGSVADLRRTVQVLLLALEGGDQWEIDNAVALARQTLALLDGLATPPAPKRTIPTLIHIPLTRKVTP